MGVNIIVYDVESFEELKESRAEEWDACRYVGDRDYRFGSEIQYRDFGDQRDGTTYQRPKSIEAERKLLNEIIEGRGSWANYLPYQLEFTHKRFTKLLDLLEKNPSYWVYWSY